MPIYEYRCPNGHTFELFQRMTDPPPSECQICGESPLEKVLYPAALHFKGSGFYKTDSRTTSKKSSSSNASSDKPAGTEKSSDKSTSGESSSGQSSPDTGKPTTPSSSSGQVA